MQEACQTIEQPRCVADTENERVDGQGNWRGTWPGTWKEGGAGQMREGRRPPRSGARTAAPGLPKAGSGFDFGRARPPLPFPLCTGKGTTRPGARKLLYVRLTNVWQHVQPQALDALCGTLRFC